MVLFLPHLSYRGIFNYVDTRVEQREAGRNETLWDESFFRLLLLWTGDDLWLVWRGYAATMIKLTMHFPEIFISRIMGCVSSTTLSIRHSHGFFHTLKRNQARWPTLAFSFYVTPFISCSCEWSLTFEPGLGVLSCLVSGIFGKRELSYLSIGFFPMPMGGCPKVHIWFVYQKELT